MDAPGVFHGWVDGGGDIIPGGLRGAVEGGSHSAFERTRICDKTPDTSPINERLPSLRLTSPDNEPGFDPDHPDSDAETCYNPDEDEECKFSRLPDLPPPDPSTVLHQRREDLKEKLVDTPYPRTRNPERARPEAHYVLSPSRLRPRPLPSPRPRTPVPPSGIRSTKRAHTPTASQIRRDMARNAARGYRWDRVFRATFDEGVRAGYRAGHGHKVVAYAILQGGRTMDWTLDEWHAGRFRRAMRGGYGRGVEGVLMGEAREAEREVEEAWMAEGEYEWREGGEGEDEEEEEGGGCGDEDEDGVSDGEEGSVEGGVVDEMEDEEELEEVDLVGDEGECGMVEVLDGVGGDGFEFVERCEAEDELEEGIIEIPGAGMADVLEEGVLVETPPKAERYPARPGLFTLCRR